MQCSYHFTGCFKIIRMRDVLRTVMFYYGLSLFFFFVFVISSVLLGHCFVSLLAITISEATDAIFCSTLRKSGSEK